MGKLSASLIDNLLEELTARDEQALSRLRLSLSPDAIDAALLARSPVTRKLPEPTRRESIARLHMSLQGAHGEEIADTPLFTLLLDGLADALLADAGLNTLKPAPDVASLSLPHALETLFERHETARGAVYISKQQGTPLVVIGALGIPLHAWQRLVAEPQGWRLILPELPCGTLLEGGMRSEADVHEYADILTEQLAALTLPARPWLLGWCNGGRIALELARRLRERVEGLFLLCPTLRDASAPQDGSAYENKLQQLFSLVLGNPKTAPSVAVMASKLLAAPDTSRLHGADYLAALRGLPRRSMAGALSVPMQDAGALLNYARRTAKDEAFARGRDYHHLPMPVYLIQGADDPVVSNTQARRWLRERLTTFDTFQITGAGHVPQDLQFPWLMALLNHARQGQRSSLPRRVIHYHGEH
ncbi:alpha/beta hydrolase [Cronobacter muytjensii]|uniref:Alpha/beta hydrolase n=1 Tax=Cronobacter muytjensii TaxID=413501 RepID=A0A2T7AUH3_9ENTR|nr:alpha/beta hydrolase [Cronobacter muytjensii]ELY3985369.1 alpha/beta hydrolase [Cronobacter muytjensii]ELY4672408.1 alpha/beta hydrolase [Cronobacter muytjensii]KAB0883802.1 alpha/beta hydrolase [Cronobacter muytjensii]MBF4811260.1 alpha/beta hydrolase [Cronobacter muytjensii]PUX15428.1 alpha/beta hydrolase [Cronobacter muytjensii]